MEPTDGAAWRRGSEIYQIYPRSFSGLHALALDEASVRNLPGFGALYLQA